MPARRKRGFIALGLLASLVACRPGFADEALAAQQSSTAPVFMRAPEARDELHGVMQEHCSAVTAEAIFPQL